MSVRPDLATGTRIRTNNPAAGHEGWTWVIIEGRKHTISDDAYATLYATTSGIRTVEDAEDIEDGGNANDAFLARNPEQEWVYLVHDSTRFHISSAEAFTRLGFNPADPRTLDQEEFDALGIGEDIV